MFLFLKGGQLSYVRQLSYGGSCPGGDFPGAIFWEAVVWGAIVLKPSEGEGRGGGDMRADCGSAESGAPSMAVSVAVPSSGCRRMCLTCRPQPQGVVTDRFPTKVFASGWLWGVEVCLRVIGWGQPGRW